MGAKKKAAAKKALSKSSSSDSVAGKCENCSKATQGKDCKQCKPRETLHEIIEKAARSKRGAEDPFNVEKMRSYLTPQVIHAAALQGDTDAMYMMGILCTNRLEFAEDLAPTKTLTNGTVHDNTTSDDDFARAFAELNVSCKRSSAEADTRAYTWFRRAAENSHVASMHSVAHRLRKGIGVAQDLRGAMDWYIRAYELGSTTSFETFCEQSALTREAISHLEGFKHVMSARRIPLGTKMPIHAPTLHGLLMAVGCNRLRKEGYRSLYYRKHCMAFDTIVSDVKLPPLDAKGPSLELGDLQVTFIAGRAGTGKPPGDSKARALTPALDARSLETALYRIGYFRGLNEVPEVTDFQRRRWFRAFPPYLNVCLHLNDNKPISSCTYCLLDAKRRLAAISYGQYALSIRETRHSAYGAVYLDVVTGEAYHDEFKGYCRYEIDTVLRELCKDGWGFLHPFHIAQDPNLLWPIIHYYGSVRGAIETLAPHVRWAVELGHVERVDRSDLIPPQPVTQDGNGAQSALTRLDRGQPQGFFFGPEHEGQLFYQCARDDCLTFEIGRNFSVCGKCKRKKYCSRECQVADWKSHKAECSASA